jgi:hypothetical protein
MRKVPKPGDRVVVPAGGREVEGIVTYVSPIFDPPHVQVEYRTDEEDESATSRNLFPIDMIRPAPARAA